jgi:hypothetical protein
MQFLMALGLNLEMHVNANLTSRSSRIAVNAVWFCEHQLKKVPKSSFSRRWFWNKTPSLSLLA